MSDRDPEAIADAIWKSLFEGSPAGRGEFKGLPDILEQMEREKESDDRRP